MRVHPHSKSPVNYYGSFAYASVVLTCFAGFLYTNNISGPPWRVVVTFLLGAIYVLIAILDNGLTECLGEPWRWKLFATNCAVATAMLYISPIRGYFGIIIMPLVAQAIIDFRPPVAWFAGIGLFCMSVGVFVYYYGLHAIPEAVLSYATAFAFTGVFTAITKQAVTARSRAEELSRELAEANERLRAHAAQAEDLATTRERNRVAREIHDGVGHYLTVVKTQLDAAAAILPAHPDKAREAILKAAKLSGDALDDVRRSVGALRTDATRPPLPDALRALVHEAGLPVTVRIVGDARPLAPGIEHALFRSAQEGLTNIRKHAAATAAELTLDFRDRSRAKLTVADNGRGAAGAVTGFGLIGIRERLAVLGGRADAANRPEGGFVLTVEVPA